MITGKFLDLYLADNVDGDGEVFTSLSTKGGSQIFTWLDKDMATDIIKHLAQKFEINLREIRYDTKQ